MTVVPPPSKFGTEVITCYNNTLSMHGDYDTLTLWFDNEQLFRYYNKLHGDKEEVVTYDHINSLIAK